MGTSDRRYKPEMTLHVSYSHVNKPVDTDMLRQIAFESYDTGPWIVDGETVPLISYVSGQQHGNAHGEFTLHVGLSLQVVKGSQQVAFERMCRRIASELASSSHRWCLSCSIQMNVCYESIDGEIFRSAV